MGVEAVEIFLAQVQAGDTVDHPLRDGLSGAWPVRQPDRLAGPEPAHVERLTDQRMGIGGEGEHAVHLFDELGRPQGGIEVLGAGQRGLEEVVAERHAGGHHRIVLVAPDVRRVDQDRLVAVGPQQIALVVLAEVHRLVLVADERGRLPGRLPLELGQRVGDGVEVLHGLQRDGDARHPPNHRTPDASGAQDLFTADTAALREDRLHATVADFDADHPGPAEKACPLRRCQPRQRLAGAGGPDRAVMGHVNGAVQVVDAHDGHHPLDLIGPDQVGLQSPRGGVAVAALQLLPALGRGGDLQAADLSP